MPGREHTGMQPSRAITFDFHNTLVTCDAWFRLEVYDLVSDFLGWRADRLGLRLDGTTQAAARSAYRRLRRAIHVHGHELPADRCIATVLADLNIAASDDEIHQGIEVLMRRALPQATPQEGAVETIRELAAAGVTLAVISSAIYHPFLEWALDAFGIRDTFAVIMTSASTGYYKSRPEIYWETLQRIGVTPDRALHVGDSLRFDVEGARRAGMRAVLVTRELSSLDAREDTADLTISTLQGAAPSLLALLEQSPTAARSSPSLGVTPVVAG